MLNPSVRSRNKTVKNHAPLDVTMSPRLAKPGGLLLLTLAMLCVSPATSFAQIRLASRFGEMTVGGQRLIVHVTVAVPVGANAVAVADDAVRGQGARPFEPEAFVVTGFVWDQFFNAQADLVGQFYNPSGEPLGAATLLQSSEATWTNVSDSRFAFSYAGTTTRCPSLVKECPGPQVFDGHNDVGWLSLSGCCTLAVTWSGTSIDEADIALNTRFAWTSSGGSGYDVRTVMLHENGHVVGLGHSSATDSIMQATYAGLQHNLGTDDARGVTYLYPGANAVGDISGTVTAAIGGAAIAGAKVQIADFPVWTTTDSNGHYILSGVPNIGFYTMTASVRRYESQTVESVTVGSETDFQLDSKGR
jgi:hypothetical protein